MFWFETFYLSKPNSKWTIGHLDTIGPKQTRKMNKNRHKQTKINKNRQILTIQTVLELILISEDRQNCQFWPFCMIQNDLRAHSAVSLSSYLLLFSSKPHNFARIKIRSCKEVIRNVYRIDNPGRIVDSLISIVLSGKLISTLSNAKSRKLTFLDLIWSK